MLSQFLAFNGGVQGVLAYLVCFGIFTGVWATGWLARGLAIAVVAITASGCSNESEPETAAPASTSAISHPLRAASLEEVVEAAYLASWDAYAFAVRELDQEGLDRVYAGDALRTVMNEIARRRREGAPVRVDVDHRATVQILESRTDALVRDTYLNRSVRLDPATGERAEPIKPEMVNETYQMKLLGDTWKVVAIVRSDS